MPFRMRYMRLQPGFLLHFFLSPMYELIYGNIEIFLLKCRMHRGEHIKGGQE